LEQNTASYASLQDEIRGQIFDAVHAIQEFQENTGMFVPELFGRNLSEIFLRPSSSSYRDE
jgi:hypothetical protein